MDGLFRKKSMEQISSPENLNDYIKVTNPGIWIVIVVAILFLVSLCVWCVIGIIDITVDIRGYSDGGDIYCYLSDEDISLVAVGMDVKSGEKRGRVKQVSQIPDDYSTMAERLGGENIVHALCIADDEWRYLVVVEGFSGDEGVVDISIVTERINPIRYLSDGN